MNIKDYHRSNIERMFSEKGRICLNCGRVAVQAAHGIPQRVHEIEKYGWLVVHHWNNLSPACSLECNAALQVPREFWPVLARETMETMILEEEQ